MTIALKTHRKMYCKMKTFVLPEELIEKLRLASLTYSVKRGFKVPEVKIVEEALEMYLRSE